MGFSELLSRGAAPAAPEGGWLLPKFWQGAARRPPRPLTGISVLFSRGLICRAPQFSPDAARSDAVRGVPSRSEQTGDGALWGLLATQRLAAGIWGLAERTILDKVASPEHDPR